MKPTHLAITLAICSACFIAPQIASASGWGNVFDPTRHGKNVLIYAEKIEQLGLDSKIYANMALKIAKLAGVDTAKNETMKHLEEYVNNPVNPLDLDQYIGEITEAKLGSPYSLDDILVICDGDKKTNAKLLEIFKKDAQEQSKLEKTVNVILELKSDGTLGELQKGNFLDGLSTSQKLAKINRLFMTINKDIQETQAEQMEEESKKAKEAQVAKMKVVDPYDTTEKGQKEKELYDEAAEHLTDAFGQKGYKTSDLGFPKF